MSQAGPEILALDRSWLANFQLILDSFIPNFKLNVIRIQRISQITM